MSGPLQGLKVIEFGGIGPGPFCAMMLSDMGADVIRLDRKADKGKDLGDGAFLASGRRSVLHRGRRSMAVDLKSPEDVQRVLALVDGADAIIEGFRPGVMERLGLGPDVLLARHPRLVYGRMTGWGQDGPLAQAAGHDINYIALSGALSMIGRTEGGPVAPPAMVGDLGGGGMMLAFGTSAPYLKRATPAVARSSMPPSPTVQPCSPPSSATSRRWDSGRTSVRPTCWTAARISMTPMSARMANGYQSPR